MTQKKCLIIVGIIMAVVLICTWVYYLFINGNEINSDIDDNEIGSGIILRVDECWVQEFWCTYNDVEDYDTSLDEEIQVVTVGF